MFMESSFYVSSFRTDRKAVRSGVSTLLREIPGSRFARPEMTPVAVVRHCEAR
jgi:hypothetical protein